MIQVCLVPELDGLTKPNREGQLPFLDGDPIPHATVFRAEPPLVHPDR